MLLRTRQTPVLPNEALEEEATAQQAIANDQSEEAETIIMDPANDSALDLVISETKLMVVKSEDALDADAVNLKKASEGVVVASTIAEYARQWIKFKQFCVRQNYLGQEHEIDDMHPNFPENFPTLVALWIMEKCDPMDIHTGEIKHPNQDRASYSYAQKMRAAVSHKFSREYRFGTQPWTENPMNPGFHTGNVSLSPTISQYMISLQRRKVIVKVLG
ncbi:hypothetical protein BD410DRAFT_901994 [Rickenella mellea]|uniref:Uncharacterized protein n=1 Tax=Rickenella mellea TaxID=50990 RepID=A0A4Y7PPM7_9AGAM|nr:hypothetical protein BD410DRAFT_901994 [Rickenella mellea]